MLGYGCQSMWGDLERVLVRRPLPEDEGHIERYGWRGVPDHAAAAKEHEALCMLLEAAGAEVIVSEHDAGNPDAIYTYDPVLVGDEGAALLRPGKAGRQGEPEAIAVGLEAAGVPVVSGSPRPPPLRAATPSGSTERRCLSVTATAPERRGSTLCAMRSRGSGWWCSISRIGTVPAR